MGFRKINYKGKIIKVIWKSCTDCYGMYDSNSRTLTIHPEQSNYNLAKTIYHELWHIICDLNEVDINKIGEEKTAKLSEQYVNLLKNNKRLKNFLNELY